MSTRAYISAARLRTLPLSVSGIILGSFIAAADGFFNWTICTLAILTTLGFQIISNFANDYGDGVKGTDNEHRIGPKRAIQSGELTQKQMLKAITISVVITFIIAIGLIYKAFGKEDLLNFTIFFVLGVASIIAAIKYTMGSKAYGYSGFGDLFVFLFFGLVSVVGSYYLYAKQLNISIFILAFCIGFLSVGVLNLNNMRDRESDVKSGKNTLVVKIGAEFAKYYHYYLLFSTFLFSLGFIILNFRSSIQLIGLLSFIPITSHFYAVYKNIKPIDLDPELKKLALSTLLYAILFGFSYYVA